MLQIHVYIEYSTLEIQLIEVLQTYTDMLATLAIVHVILCVSITTFVKTGVSSLILLQITFTQIWKF